MDGKRIKLDKIGRNWTQIGRKLDGNNMEAKAKQQTDKVQTKQDLLEDISKLFDDMGETTRQAKQHWTQVWLRNKKYNPALPAKDLSRKQLLELKADIEEVLSM